MTQAQILVVEDEQELAEVLAVYLRQAGFAVHLLARGDLVLPWLAKHRADLLILDVMLPGMDGFELARRIRGSDHDRDIPILFTTARTAEGERIAGFGLGADDYICKPYSPREMAFRVQAVLRRTGAVPAQLPAAEGLQLDERSHRLSFGGQVVQLTAVEFRLMQTMCSQPGCIFSRQQLIDLIYVDGRVVSERTVDSHIKKLRRKVESLGGKERIEAVYGLGYRATGGLP